MADREGDVYENDAGDRIILRNNRWVPVPKVGDTFLTETASGAIDNLLNLPTGLANQVINSADTNRLGLGARGVNFLSSMMGAERPVFGPNGSLPQLYTPQLPQLSPNADTTPFQVPYPSIDADDVIGAGRFALDKAGLMDGPGTLSGNIQAQEDFRQLGQEQNPMAAAAGGLGGDVASLVTLRTPFAKTRGQTALRSRLDIEAQAAAIPRTVDEIMTNPSLKRAADQMFNNTSSMLFAKNRAGRVAEAGLEGYALGLMERQDPIELAGYAAMAQATGSAILGLQGFTMKGGFTPAMGRLAGSALAIGMGWQAIQGLTPIEDKSWIDSLGDGIDKVVLGIGGALLVGAAGMGRASRPTDLVAALPRIADHMTAIPRAALISGISELQDDSQAEAVVNKLISMPDYFGPSASRQLERAMSVEDVSISETIERLANNSNDFRSKLEAL